jgi:hypothetical protein
MLLRNAKCSCNRDTVMLFGGDFTKGAKTESKYVSLVGAWGSIELRFVALFNLLKKPLYFVL